MNERHLRYDIRVNKGIEEGHENTLKQTKLDNALADSNLNPFG